MRVHILRHGESASNAAPGAIALPGDEGDRLTELGRRQALEAGRHLGGLGATRILTSPLRRARETAEALASSLELPIVSGTSCTSCANPTAMASSAPRSSGCGAGRSGWRSTPAIRTTPIRGGESFNDVLGRVRAVQDRLVAEGDHSVLAVSHGIFTRFFLMWSLLGDRFDPGQAQRLWQLGSHNCGLSSFEHLEPGASGYATDSWRCLTWMQRPWDPP